MFDLNLEALGPRIVGYIELGHAERRVAQGTARRLYLNLGKNGEEIFAGYQLCEAPKVQESRPSSLFLTGREADLIAGQAFVGGQSHTALLNEEERLLRQQSIKKNYGRTVALEDDIELANAKLAGMHPRLSYQDRIVRVRSKPSK